jgi:gamma-glutamyltranspeptidase / glutathione hydrolase
LGRIGSAGHPTRTRRFYRRSGLVRATRATLAAQKSPALRELLVPTGDLLEGSWINQPELGETLQMIAEEGVRAFTEGRLGAAIAQEVLSTGGVMRREDIARHEVAIERAATVSFLGSTIFGPQPETTGFGVLADALQGIGSEPWPTSHDAATLGRMRRARAAAWAGRNSASRRLVEAASKSQTTHLCAADRDGRVISLTFTHGPLWFGSGLVVRGTGIILNCGANPLVRDSDSGERFAQSNIAPLVAHSPTGSRFALGTRGGYRIPAIELGILVDVLVRGTSIESARHNPRVSTSPDGRLEVEPALSALAPDACQISVDEFYGPASYIEVSKNGTASGGIDPRFNGAIALAD